MPIPAVPAAVSDVLFCKIGQQMRVVSASNDAISMVHCRDGHEGRLPWYFATQMHLKKTGQNASLAAWVRH